MRKFLFLLIMVASAISCETSTQRQWPTAPTALPGVAPAVPAEAGASPNGAIGIVGSLDGEWWFEGRPPHKVRAGDEIPAGARLVVADRNRTGPDNRVIRIVMFDGTDRIFECARPTVCEGPLVLTLAPVMWSDELRHLVARVVRQIFGTGKFTPLIARRRPPASVDGSIDLVRGIAIRDGVRPALSGPTADDPVNGHCRELPAVSAFMRSLPFYSALDALQQSCVDEAVAVELCEGDR